MTIRPIVETDVINCIELWTAHNMASESDQARVFYLLKQNPGLSYLAADGTMIIGAVLCSYNGLSGTLAKLLVTEEYRGQGIAKELISECVKTLRKKGAESIGIACKRDLLDWYRSQGFTFSEDAIFVTKSL